MLEIEEVPELLELGGPKVIVLQMIHHYTEKLKKLSPVTTSWIPLTEHVCLREIPQLASGIVARSLAELDEDGFIETKRFDHSCPECRCKWFRLTDKFYELLKGN